MDCQRRSLDERLPTAAIGADKGSSMALALSIHHNEWVDLPVIGMNLKVPCKITFSGKRLVASTESADVRSGLTIVARSNVVMVVDKL